MLPPATTVHSFQRGVFRAIVRTARQNRCISSEAPSTIRKPRVVFSGIQPTGVPHLGNYLGALLNWVHLQRTAAPEDTLLFSVVGWHALTLPQDPAGLRAARHDMLATMLAIGLDPKRSIIFHQDHNPDHVELAWILNCLAPVGKLRRMTTWKSRLATARNANNESEVDESMLNTGLFTYPVLQAADILAYRATHVPVGEDQTQHLELTRDLGDTFNRTFKKGGPKLFPLPETLLTPTRRVLSLREPTQKMSKSAPDPRSRVLLTDSSAEIARKLKSAATDSEASISFDPSARPGTSNLLSILAACEGGEASPQQIAERYTSKGHAALKQDVADAVVALLEGPRREFERIKNEAGYVEQVQREGAARARELSSKTLALVRERLGLA